MVGIAEGCWNMYCTIHVHYNTYKPVKTHYRNLLAHRLMLRISRAKRDGELLLRNSSFLKIN